MKKKGVSRTLWIIITIVIILIVALVVLNIFGMNVQVFGQRIAQWLGLMPQQPVTECTGLDKSACTISGCRWCPDTEGTGGKCIGILEGCTPT